VQTASQGNTARPFASPCEPMARTSPYVLAISSGKGGVGKTNVVINLAVEIQRRGLRVLVFDADLGLSNVPILLGLVPEYNISHVLFFNIVSHDNIVVVCPEPASMSDAYVLMKILALQYQRKTFKVLMNSVKEESEAALILDRITEACQRFLGVSVRHFGNIPYDRRIREAVRSQKPVVELYPDAASSQSFSELATRLLGSIPDDYPVGSLQFFWKRLFSSDISEWAGEQAELSRARPTLVRS